MSRNFTADQFLTERLVINDTKAFEEVYHRYWYSLYFFGMRKLQCRDESRQLVQKVFVELWQKRHSLTTSFHLAQDLYEEAKKDVTLRLEQRLTIATEESEEELVLENEEVGQLLGDTMEVTTQPRKLVRYVSNDTSLAENRRTPNWTSGGTLNTYLSCQEKEQLQDEMLEEIQAHTAYPLLFPKKESPWWQRIAAMF